MPAISVILPTRDRPELLGRACASLEKQTWRDFEVVIVDNNRATSRITDSPKLTGEPRVHVVHAPNAANAAQARNAGLEVATGDWITFLDDDDEYAPGKLARQVEVAQATGSPMVLCGYEVELGLRRRRIQVERTQFAGDELLVEAVWGTPFIFLRREGAPRFAAELDAAEDLWFAHAALASFGVHRVPSVPEPLVRVHLQPPETRVNVSHDAHWRAELRVLTEFGPRFSEGARRRFKLRAELQRAKGGQSWRELLGCAGRLVVDGGIAECRRVANALAYRSRWLRPYVVS